MDAKALMGDLHGKLTKKEANAPISFEEFLNVVARKPHLILRDIFQLTSDMITFYMGSGTNEYPDDPESINYVLYDTNSMFVKRSDNPFFADRPFANRLMNVCQSFKQGAQQNKMFIFKGPHGCGKSTFLNNFLLKIKEYANGPQGERYEILWRIDKNKITSKTLEEKTNILEVPCPSHDYPILMIPKRFRKEFLDELIADTDFKKHLFNEKEYEWVFKREACTVCTSLYRALSDKLDSTSQVTDMIYAKRLYFSRRLGEGVTIFSQGDPTITLVNSKQAKIGTKNHHAGTINQYDNPVIQEELDRLFGSSGKVKYVYSELAKTNNGAYALMDIKDHNIARFYSLHGIISEGVHKVNGLEEAVNSLFIALINPEDASYTSKDREKSFKDRIHEIKLPYVLDYSTEVQIYKNIFGENIEKDFLPRVLTNFAKVIIASRLHEKSEGMQDWIKEAGKYDKYCDKNLLLLKMDIYGGRIPQWLSDEDIKSFTAKRRKKIIDESEHDGDRGFSGRQSIDIFNDFYSAYGKKGNRLITMANVYGFFTKLNDAAKHKEEHKEMIPGGFLESLVRLYDYNVLQEIKEALYSYNTEKIKTDILNYICAVNFDNGATTKCKFTSEIITVNDAFFDTIEYGLFDWHGNEKERKNFRDDVQNKYVSEACKEMELDGKQITETDLYLELVAKYERNLKENVLEPIIKNENFRRAVKDYGTSGFNAHDGRIKRDVSFLIGNLKTKFSYTDDGAKEVCVYAIDSGLTEKFKKKG